jgi:hypothetical protein
MDARSGVGASCHHDAQIQLLARLVSADGNWTFRNFPVGAAGEYQTAIGLIPFFV